MQFIIGVIFGIVQRHAFSENGVTPWLILLYSLLFYPLLNSFFDDRFFSILSSWIQYSFWSYLLMSDSAMLSMEKSMSSKRISMLPSLDNSRGYLGEYIVR